MSDTPVIDRRALVDVAGDNFDRAKGSFGKCYLKLYQGNYVVAKEFRSTVTKIDVVAEARMLQGLSHPGLPVLLEINLDTTPYIMVTLFYGINKVNSTLFAVLSSPDHETQMTIIKAIVIIIKELSEAIQYLHRASWPMFELPASANRLWESVQDRRRRVPLHQTRTKSHISPETLTNCP